MALPRGYATRHSFLADHGDVFHRIPHARERHYMIIRLFMDAAGGSEHRVVTAAGYIASEEQWAEFRQHWVPLVEEAWDYQKYPDQAPFFHAAEFFPCGGHFSHIGAGSAFHRDLARRFAEVAYGCLPNGFSFTVGVRDYQSIMRPAAARIRRPEHVPPLWLS